ncbi:hypothetical protein B0H19DRAFT_1084191 [Mycena capillaripes]|nr:hypothetical protein B0H19DRAFT_1084191 [Mycena capillaripes]
MSTVLFSVKECPVGGWVLRNSQRQKKDRWNTDTDRRVGFDARGTLIAGEGSVPGESAIVGQWEWGEECGKKRRSTGLWGAKPRDICLKSSRTILSGAQSSTGTWKQNERTIERIIERKIELGRGETDGAWSSAAAARARLS